MEDVLDVYKQPYDPLRSQICFDERPCQLLGTMLISIPMTPENPKREDYEYRRHGTWFILLAFERQTGFRYIQVRQQSTNIDYKYFMKEMVE
jgi:hypothetical protein